VSGPLLSAGPQGFPEGLTFVTREGEAALDTGMDLAIYRSRGRQVVEAEGGKEMVFVHLDGQADLSWEGGQARGLRRSSLFDEAGSALHVPAGMPVAVDSGPGGSEWAVVRATNPRPFAPRFYRPDEVKPEFRGHGLVQDASLRNVRLYFDDATRPEAEVVIGEVVNYPGRWSSYPPHHHRQAEIYHYRFTEPQGYGHAELGDRVHKVQSHDTLKILDGVSHAQVSAPGYGMWYLWIVRHLPGQRYTGFTYTKDHEWTLDPARQGWCPPGVSS
jgi:5-deoxy-glucuronate isomerase